MKRLTTLLVGCALALAACGKKEDEKKEPAPKTDEPKVEHGEKQGKGDGGGDKTAAGSKDGTRGSAKPAADAKLIERGAYISNLGGCPLCHTAIDMTTMQPKMDMAFAGGLEMTEELGSWRSPNITPDPETGIGKWTDEQILAAIRDGVRPDGSKVGIFMPWPFYATMTDEDGKALVAFLRSLPPVVNKVERIPPPAMELPPMPPPKRVDPVDDPVGHGAYLASIMHCVMCHTPFTEKGPDFSKAFAGGFQMSMPPGMGEGEIWSSNITPDPETGIGKWSEEDIAKTIKTMVRPNGKPIVGPMMFYAATWSKVTDEDAMAVAKFLKSVPPIKNKVKPTTYKLKGPPPGPPPADQGTPEDKPADKEGGKQPT